MAFKITIQALGEQCDICGEIDESRPMLQLAVTGKEDWQRNTIWVHLDEFESKLAREKAKLAAKDSAGQWGQL